MSPLNKEATSHLAEQFADIYQMTQEDYRELLTALRDETTDLSEFTVRANALADGLIKLKRIRVQLRHERDELDQLNREDSDK